MNTATYHHLNNITKHSGLIRNGSGKKVYNIKYIRLHTTEQALLLMDSNYCQLLGFRNRTELLAENGIEGLAEYTLYHCPFKNKVYRIETDELSFVSDVRLMPINFSGVY